MLGSPLKQPARLLKVPPVWLEGTKLLARGALSAGRFLLGLVLRARLAGTAVAAVGGAPAVLAAAAIGGAAYGGYKRIGTTRKVNPTKPD